MRVEVEQVVEQVVESGAMRQTRTHPPPPGGGAGCVVRPVTGPARHTLTDVRVGWACQFSTECHRVSSGDMTQE